MSTGRSSLVVGNHETLDAAADELRARGDDVIRIAEADAAAELSAVDRIVGDAGQVRLLVIGHAATPGTGLRALSLIRAATARLASAGGGRVVLITSRDYLGWPGRAEAAVETAGLVGLTRSLALELGSHGITVNAVCPPADLGPVTATEDPWDAPPPPLTGPVDAGDVAYSVAFLSDEASGYITGQVVHVSGGLSVLSSLSA